MMPEEGSQAIVIVVPDRLAHALALGQCRAPLGRAGQAIEYSGGCDRIEHVEIAENRREDRVDETECVAGEKWPGAEFRLDALEFVDEG